MLFCKPSKTIVDYSMISNCQFVHFVTSCCPPGLKMQISFFKTLLSFIAFGKCHAGVTWRTFGCDTYTLDGATIDQIWDNANDMATNAQTQISLIPNSLVGVMQGGQNAKIAGANAQMMWGIKYGKTGTNSAGQATMEDVNSA
jgi:hypothetical protein